MKFKQLRSDLRHFYTQFRNLLMAVWNKEILVTPEGHLYALNVSVGFKPEPAEVALEIDQLSILTCKARNIQADLEDLIKLEQRYSHAVASNPDLVAARHGLDLYLGHRSARATRMEILGR